MKPVPKDLGGYQNIVTGIVHGSDLMIDAHDPTHWQWGMESHTGMLVEDVLDMGFRTYREMPVMKPGDLDHKPGNHSHFMQVVPDSSRPNQQTINKHLDNQFASVEEQIRKLTVGFGQSGIPKSGFQEKAKTNDEGKPPLAWLPPDAIRAVAMVQAYGHKKYKDNWNWRKGLEQTRAISCALRHIYKHLDREDLDPESQQMHLAHAICRLMFLLQNIKDGTAIDDRWKKE